jgi:DNA/RNA endonuclease G (NUC1)
MYDTSRKIAIYVRERLTKDIFGTAGRTNNWKTNVTLPAQNRAINEDYVGTGFDKGHLVPAEDATESLDKMAETFFLDNAVPQDPNPNRGVWSRLEGYVRQLTSQNDVVEVFTGPLFVPEEEEEKRMIKYQVIGRADVHVPTHLFKVIYLHNKRTTRKIYLVPNKRNEGSKPYSHFRRDDALDFIQQHSGILFSQWNPE